MWEGRFLYFMSSFPNLYGGNIGVVEDVLIGLDEIRDIRLKELGI